jgi:cyclase
MIKKRIIPVLLLQDSALVKTIKFNKASYIGDPANTVRIFNELEVDELVFLDIAATRQNHQPNLTVLGEIANECFMPLAYGGGIRDFDTAERIFAMGFEKLIFNTIAFDRPQVISQIANHYGSQAVIASIDVKKNLFGKTEVWTECGTRNTKKNPVEWAKELENLGVGEILLTSIDREGTWSGFDVEMIKKVTSVVSIPVIVHGGAGSLADIEEVVKQGHASAIALGSMVVYQQKGMGVLVNFPDRDKLNRILE